TINNSTTTNWPNATACDSYTWGVNGVTYTSSGVYTYITTNASGCDNVATLTLTINNSSTTSTSITACDSYTWAANSTTYTSSGVYTFATTNASGCDSTATLNLTINNNTSTSATETACDSYTWVANGTTYTTSGTYTNTSTNSSGCTLTETLILTINNSTTTNWPNATACDSYTWGVNGVTYTSSGVYTYITTNASGCDNV
ncbi:MAG: hypothetical protein GY754_23200, partial [bacterium]|nr:hypothetical protein [bacterium]